MKRKSLVISIIILLIAFVAGWFVTEYYLSFEREKPKQITDKPQQSIDIQPDGRYAMTVKIFYPSENGVESKEMTIYTNYLPVNIAEEVTKEFLRALKGEISNTRLLGVYRDSNNTIYIDFSDDIRRYFSADARYEYNFIESLLKTIFTNIEAIENIKLIVEGKEIESIGGHFYSLYPLKK